MRRGDTSSVALTQASLAAIAEGNDRLNAFVSVDPAAALAAAHQADVERAAGRDRGPLHGIPISIKDLIDVRGQVTTAGSRVLDDRVADRDATLVTRILAAGAIILGRTNLHQFALGTTSEDSAFGPVRHPADVRRGPGGSSGGSAAAVASGMGLASIGTDTGGSVRIPAAVCGLVGLKPSPGEVPTDGVIPLSATFDHVGPLALSVQDAAWMYHLLANRKPVMIERAPVTGLRLTVLGGYFAAPLDPIVRSAFSTAMAALEHAGAVLASATIASTSHIGDAYAAIVMAEAAHWHAPHLDARANGYLASIRDRILLGKSIPAVEYLRARLTCAVLRDEINTLFESCDAIVLPTLPIVAPLLGASDVIPDPAEGSSLPVRLAMLKHTQLFNMTGHPAISIPIRSAGLPVGMQLVGRLHQTPRLLSVAAACEAVLRAPGA
ncbi:MAG: amidase [Vicinamibacterales bacterium]